MQELVTAEKIEQRVRDLTNQINKDYTGLTLDIVCLVNSASFFCVDLIKNLRIPSRLHHMAFTSYPIGNESGEVRITLDVNEPLFGRHVLVVEGIVVSGRTPRYVLDSINLRQPASLALCALGVKASQLAVTLPLKYVAFELGPEIATGYGIGSGCEKTLANLIHNNN